MKDGKLSWRNFPISCILSHKPLNMPINSTKGIPIKKYNQPRIQKTSKNRKLVKIFLQNN